MSTILKSYLDSNADVTSPQIGSAGSVVGSPTYPSVKFNGGIYNSTYGNHAVFPLTFDTNLMTIDFWVKNDYDISDGQLSSGPYHACLQFLTGSTWTLLTFYSTAEKTSIETLAGGYQEHIFNGYSVTAGTPFHMGIVFNASGIGGGSDKLRLYINNSMVYSSTTAVHQHTGTGTLTVIAQPDVWPISAHMAVDNIRVRDAEVTDFSDYLWQDDGVPTGISASQNFYSDKVGIGWSIPTGDYTGGGMRVWRSATSGGSYSDISGLLSGTTDTYFDTTVTPGTHYFYKVTSETAAAQSAKSAYSEGWAQAAGPTPVPTGLTATTNLNLKVTLNWDAITGSSPTYKVYRCSTTGGTYLPISGYISASTFDDTSATPNVVYYYEVLANLSGTDSALSGYVLGMALPAPPALVYDIPVKKQPQIIVNGFDIYKSGHVAKLFNVSEEKTFKKSKLIFNDFNLDVNNFDDFFSRDNPKSIFYGKRLYMPVTIWNRDGLQIFNGVTLNLTRDHVAKTASIELSDTLATYSRTKIDYQSSDWETPAIAVKNIMDKYDATAFYDLNSINTSDAIYKANNAYIQCDVRQNANCYLTNFIEKIAEIGCADAYIHNDLIRFDHWQYFTKSAGNLVNLDIGNLLMAPKINILFSEIVNDYRVRYTGDNGVAITDSDANNIGKLSRTNLSVFSMPEIRSTDTSQVQIKDKTSAIYFGECLIKRTHTNLLTNPNPLQTIDIELPIQDREWLDITSHFALTFSEEGWNKKPFEVMKILFDEDGNRIKLTAYEVSS